MEKICKRNTMRFKCTCFRHSWTSYHVVVVVVCALILWCAFHKTSYIQDFRVEDSQWSNKDMERRNKSNTTSQRRGIPSFLNFSTVVRDTDYTSNGDMLTHLSSSSVTFKSKFLKDSSDQRSHRTPKGESALFTPPPGETPRQRFPNAIIIGFGKCGTRALIEFLAIHPYVAACGPEVHFFDREENFSKGYQWYRAKMPHSFSNQVTVEKTPCYVMTGRARMEIHKLNSSMRLIVIVRNPVERLVSQFLQRYRFSSNVSNINVASIYRDSRTGRFNPGCRAVQSGVYYKYIRRWLELFSLDQMLILDGDEFLADPLPTMRRLEIFLNLPKLFAESNFVRNETKGFFCRVPFGETSSRCMREGKGRAHPQLPRADEKMLYNFYKPYNEKLFQLLGWRRRWDYTQRKVK